MTLRWRTLRIPRDVVTTETAFAGWPIRLSDTAGIRDAADGLESAGIEKSKQQLQQADLRLLIFDGSQPLTADDSQFARQWLHERDENCLVIRHKSDLASVWSAQELPVDVDVSSATGAGLDDLMQAATRKLVPDDQHPPDGTALPVSSAQVQRLQTALLAIEAGNISDAVTALDV